jgi:hypothetical protein
MDMITNGGTLVLPNPVTVTGTAEVRGAVQRTHDFAAGTSYAFNRAEVTMQFAALQSADVTIDMRPNVAPSGVGANYVNRYYGVISTADLNANNAMIQLYYLDGERVGSTNEAKYGLNKYNGSTLSKLGSNGGSYARIDGSPANTIALTSVNDGLNGITQLAITPIGYATIASGTWDAVATWGSTADDIPSTTDEAEVRHTVTMGGANRTIANLTITDDASYTGILNVDNANFSVTDSVINAGTINVGSSRTLTLGGSLTNNSGAAGTVLINGIAALTRVANNGTFTVDGATAQANMSGVFNNNAGATLSTANGGSVTVTGADLNNAGAITNNGKITVQ